MAVFLSGCTYYIKVRRGGRQVLRSLHTADKIEAGRYTPLPGTRSGREVAAAAVILAQGSNNPKLDLGSFSHVCEVGNGHDGQGNTTNSNRQRAPECNRRAVCWRRGSRVGDRSCADQSTRRSRCPRRACQISDRTIGITAATCAGDGRGGEDSNSRSSRWEARSIAVVSAWESGPAGFRSAMCRSPSGVRAGLQGGVGRESTIHPRFRAIGAQGDFPRRPAGGGDEFTFAR